MERAILHYGCHRIDPSDVRQTGEDRFVVELGDHPAELPPDTHVAGLCRRMYSVVCRIVPTLVYLYASGEDFEQDAVGMPMEGDREVEWKSRDSFRGADADADDWRLRAITMAHVAVTLVQRFGLMCETASFGTGRHTYTFASFDRARLALAVERTHNIGTPRDVLAEVSRSLDRPCMGEIFGERVRPVVRGSRHLDDGDRVCIGTSDWVEMVARTRSRRFHGASVHLWTLAANRRNCALRLVFVEHHWEESYDAANRPCLRHRLVSSCNLVFHVHAVGGGTVVFACDDSVDDLSLWWVCDDMHRVNSDAHVALLSRNGDRSCVTVPSVRVRHDDPTSPSSLTNMNKRARQVVAGWRKSSAARGVRAPTLVRMLSVPDEHLVTADGALLAERRYSLEEINGTGDAGDMFRDEFGKAYGNEVVERVCEFPDMGCYLVTDTTSGERIGAFCAAVFECVLHDGSASLALMIDTFVVPRRLQGKGYGGRLLFDLCIDRLIHTRLLLHQDRYVVFAQCVVSKPGRDFWHDKLDESSDARSMCLQALSLHPNLVSVQLTSCCTPRSREYIRQPPAVAVVSEEDRGIALVHTSEVELVVGAQ